MKILFVSHSAVLKEHQQKLNILAEKFGHEIWLVMPPHWLEGGIDINAYTENKNIHYIVGKVFYPKKTVHFYLNAGEIVKKVNPDIIHIEEEPFDFSCFQFLRQAKKYGKKVLFFTWENIKRKYNPLYTYFNNYCLKNADAALAGNIEAKEILLEKDFNKQVEVIPQYGINLEDFKTKKNGRTEGPLKIAYIGRLTAEKGLTYLVSACANLPNSTLHLAGTGSMEAVLHNLIKHFKLEDRVKFYGHVKRQAVPDFLLDMDCLVLPSITTEVWKEQFGRVIIEAFAAGVVVIGSDSGEIPNVIGAAGLIFKECNAQDLAEQIKKLAEDKTLYVNLQAKGFKRVKENYTNEIIAEQINNMYKVI
ncbi:MAG: glycosyltransferase family 4 protein [bacterium]